MASMAEKGLGRMRAAARDIFRRAFIRLAACAIFAAGGACANIVAVETAPQPAKPPAPAVETAAPFTLPVFAAPARHNVRIDALIRDFSNLNAEPMLSRVGVLAYSPPWYDGAFVDETIRYLGWKLPQYAFSVRYYTPEEIRRAIQSRENDLAAASSVFFFFY